MDDLSFFLAGGIVVATITFLVLRIGNADGAACWMLSWVAIIASGLDRMLIPPFSPLAAITPIWDTLFAALLLAGALRFTGKTKQTLYVMIGAGVIFLARLLTEPLFGTSFGTYAATVLIFIGATGASLTLWMYGAATRDRVGQTLSLVFLAPAIAQSHYAVVNTTNGDLSAAYFVWLVAGILLIMVQLMLLVDRARRAGQVQANAMAKIAEAAPIGICLTREDGEVLALNRHGRDLISEDEQTWATRLRDACGHADQATLETAAPRKHTFQVHHKRLEATGAQPAHIYFFFAASTPASDYLDSLHNLAGSFAHVFNNELTVIAGNTELIRHTRHEDIQEFVRDIEAATTRCARMTRDFLNWSSVASVSGVQPTAIRPIIEEVLGSTQLASDFHLENTPAGALRVHPESFRRAIEELVDNAVNAGASHIDVTSELDETDAVVLRIADNGRGLADAVAARAFEPFYSTRQNALGAGLGLSVVRGIVNAHGGEVRLAAASNGGTEVCIRWPQNTA